MLQYTNSVHVAINETKTEVIINFLVEGPNIENMRTENAHTREPVVDLVMSGEMAKKLADLISNMMN